MNGRTPIVIVLVALLMLPAVTYTQGSGEIALRLAMETETVKGDLRAAIEQYKAIAAGPDRALATKALLRMAECYQKLGDAEGRATYERVIRDYADQREAVVEARARLSASAAAETIPRVRQIASASELGGTPMPSPDGRFVSFTAVTFVTES